MSTHRLRRFRPTLFGILLSTGVVCPSIAAERLPFRARISLNGAWERATDFETTDLPPQTGWETCQVPDTRHSFARGQTQWTWYRRPVTIPASWRGKRISLRLVGARYDARVLLDGRLVGQRLEGWTPFELELRDARPGATHELAVRCQDWSAAFEAGWTLPKDYTGDPRRVGGGHVIAPIGGHFSYYGLWDDVWLEARPPVAVDEVAIRPSWREQSLTVTGQVEGEAEGLSVRAFVLRDQQPVLSLPMVPAAGTWRLSVPISPTVTWWAPEHPALYQLRVELLRAGQVVDVHEERFGFRELWAEGPDFYFNGVKRHLLATSTWPASEPQTREEVRANLEQIKAGNNVAFRLHTQPWQQRWLEEADEVGLMIVEEGALWCDGSGTYAYGNDLFWENTWQHLAGMVRRDRNHPSLVMWSLENELLHCGASRYDAQVEQKLADLGRKVKALDPVHLITYESDHDPGGVADVVGLHYPHEMPANTDYPNTADWLSEEVLTGTGGDLLGSRRKAFRWDRKKPLYIGEYLWVPHGGFAPGTVFFGDEAYLDRTEYHVRAKAASWKPQTLAYRRAGVSGFCPWTCIGSGGRIDARQRVLYDTQKAVYEPVAAFVRQRDTRFFSGETIARTFDVFNDSVTKQALTLAWDAGEAGTEGSQSCQLPPAGYAPVEVQLPLPQVSTRRTLVLRWQLRTSAGVVHQGEQELSVCPRVDLKALPAVLVYDRQGKWSQAARAEGLRVEVLTDLSGLAAANPLGKVLVVAPHAFHAPTRGGGLPRVGEQLSESAALTSFVGRGGRVLILEQDTYAGTGLGVQLVDHASTMTFLQHSRHPALRTAKPDDFKWWRGDHYVTRKELRRPTSGGARTLLVSGGANGLDQAPLLELPMGRGTALCCQALVGEKFTTEPAARALFAESVKYLSRKPPGALSTPVISSSPDFVTQVKALGVAAVAPQPPVAPTAGRVVLFHGGGQVIRESLTSLTPWLSTTEGATLYWHAPTPADFATACKQWGLGSLALAPATGPVSVALPEHPVFSGLCREDLMFAGASRGTNWRKPFQPDTSVIEYAVLPRGKPGESRRYEVEDMELSGHIVVKSDDGKSVAFATVGQGAFTVNAPEAGTYSVTLSAKGTPAGGGWPVAVLRRDGQSLTHVVVTSREWQTYPALVTLPAGTSALTVAFTNDANIGGEDRNLMLDYLEVGREPLDSLQAKLITLPGGLAELQVGRGRVVIDCVRWDTNRRNETQGRRYASALLANLGAAFTAPQAEPDWVPASAFELESDSSYFEKTPTELRFRSTGSCAADFECAAEGKYAVVLRGMATEAAGEFGKARVTLDQTVLGEVEVSATSPATFVVTEDLTLTRGTHRLTVAFTNDLHRPPEDRNLTVMGIGFRKR